MTLIQELSYVQPPSETRGRLGFIYSIYRVVLSVFLILMFFLTNKNPALGRETPDLFITVLSLYGLLTLIELVLIKYWSKYIDLQIIGMLILDVGALTAMLYANGGPSLQMSMFYLVVVMAASILLPSAQALMITLLAIITIVYQQFFYAISSQTNLADIGSAIVLAFTFVAAYFLGQYVTNRLRLYEQLAAVRDKHLKQLQEINQRIIEEMGSGVLALDSYRQIILVNQAAKDMVRLPLLQPGVNIYSASPELSRSIDRSNGKPIQTSIVQTHDQIPIVGLHLTATPLTLAAAEPVTLVMLENTEKVNQQAQQLKLASLGRLTAGIAHEVRNPLAAITQAADLLAENLDVAHAIDAETNEMLQTESKMLVGMILKQSARINGIIEDILQLSRQSRALPEKIDLTEWLSQKLCSTVPDAAPFIVFDVAPNLTVTFDEQQLVHVLINLIANARHHASKNGQTPHIILHAAEDERHMVYLDIIDNGAGVSAAIKDTLFEPFNTTESSGTGLGLYLSRAFCEANGAHLIYVDIPKGACFRIIFGRLISPEEALAQVQAYR